MQRLAGSPCGQLVPTIEGQLAFVPHPLPSELPISSELLSLLDRTTLAVGTLAGVAETVPNPHLLIRPFLRREAVLSSRIEGTIASLSDVFAYEVAGRSRPSGDVAEVVNYVTALEYGIDRLETLPISFRLVNELHERLLHGVRGQDTKTGRIQKSTGLDRSAGLFYPRGGGSYRPHLPIYPTCSMTGRSSSTNQRTCRRLLDAL